jgi:predicted PurR-regulated permease PerM
MDLESRTVERKTRALEQIAVVLRWTAATAAVAIVVWLIGDVLLLTFAAALLALGLYGAAGRLRRVLGCSQGVSLTILVLTLVVLLALGGWWTGPRLATEASQLQDQLGQQWDKLRDWLHGTAWGSALLHQLPASLGGSASSSNLAPHLAGTIAGAVWSAIGVFGIFLLIVAAALYFAAAPGPYISGPLRLGPRHLRSRTRGTLVVVGRTLQYWLAGKLLDMLVVGVVTGTGLALLGTPLAFVLGVLAGLLNFVPYIGAIAGAVPAVLIALARGPHQAMFVTALIVVVQLLEGNVLVPLIQRRAVDLPPAATILAQTAFGALFGLPGIILATPIAAAILAALRDVTAESSDGG